jgi:uncharacterized protein (DUF1778 family)
MASNKSDRWHFRVAADSDQLVRQAAQVTQSNLSDFVLQAAMVEAERVLADRSRFKLERSAWDEFRALLDRPAQTNSRLAELFKKPSVFE